MTKEVTHVVGTHLPQSSGELGAHSIEFQKLLAIAQHVESERKARRQAERSVTALRSEMDEYIASKNQRCEDAVHLVAQVDQEIAARRQAERNLEVCEDAAREASVQAGKKCKALEARCMEAELEISAIRGRLAEVLWEAKGYKDDNATLRSQLEHFIELSEQRKHDHLGSEQCGEQLREKLAEAEKVNLWCSARIEELEYGNTTLQEYLLDAQQKHASLSKAHQSVCAELVDCREELDLHKQALEQLNVELRRRHNNIESLEAELRSCQAQRVMDREARREKDEVIDQELDEARGAVRGEGLGISGFLRNVPASTALIVLFRYILGLIAGTTERAVSTRLSLHSASEISRHEVECFLANDLSLQGLDRSVVSQALFGVLDLERHGVLYKKVLCDRLQNPPSMKTVWLSELQSAWPERCQEMLRGWVRKDRSPSPHRQPSSPQQAFPLSRSPSPKTTRDDLLPASPLKKRAHGRESPRLPSRGQESRVDSCQRAQGRDSPRPRKVSTPPCIPATPSSAGALSLFRRRPQSSGNARARPLSASGTSPM